MIVVEAHDDETSNVASGTRVARVGRKDISISDEHQAERWLGEALGQGMHLVRAYFFRNEAPIAAWLHTGHGQFRCIAHHPEYSGSLLQATPYVYPGARYLAAARLSKKIITRAQAFQWARLQLVGPVATAIFMDGDGLLAAWEPGPDGPLLVATAPRWGRLT